MILKSIISLYNRFVSFIKRIKTRELGPLLYDRKNKIYKRELLPFQLWLENEIMYSKPIDIIDRTHFIRYKLKNENITSEHVNNLYTSAKKIPDFIDKYKICMSDFIEENPFYYKTFNDFFIREVKPEKRPISNPSDKSVIVSAADSRLSVFDTLENAEKVMIKGKNFSLEALVHQKVKPADYDKGKWILDKFDQTCPTANFRLAPMDYHNFHAPVSGTIICLYHIDGEYFTVEPKALKSDINVLGENTRTIVVIDTSDYGLVLFIPIGAEAVGTVKFTKSLGDTVTKGEKLGWFEYGGSDVLVIFSTNVQWDDDVKNVSNSGLESLVQMGEHLGVLEQLVLT